MQKQQQQQTPHQNHLQQQQQQQQQQYPHMPPYVLNPIQPPQLPSTAPISTDYIQKRLDENKQLILAILDNQNLGKLAECAQYQALLQRNLLQLAAIADSQPHISAARPQMLPGVQMQQAVPYMHQPASFPPRTSMQFNTQQLPEQPPQPLLQQPQHFGLQSQTSLQPSLSNGMHVLHADGTTTGSTSGMPSAANPSDFSRGSAPSSMVDVQGSKPDAAAASDSASVNGHKDSSMQQGSGVQESHDK